MRLQVQLELALIQNSTSIADHENIRDTRLFKKIRVRIYTYSIFNQDFAHRKLTTMRIQERYS